MVDLQRAVKEHGCDFGVAFDGDADRMFLVDENGALIGGDIVTALVGIDTIRLNPGAKILYNLICSRSVPEAIEKAGGVPVRSQVGHSFIKKMMRDEEHPVRRRALRAFLLQAQLVRRFRHDRADAVPQRVQPRERHRSRASSRRSIRARVRAKSTRRSPTFRASCTNSQAHYNDATIDHLDGVTIEYPDWWMNVRPSNTEPLLRLNVEGDTKELMERHRDEALAIIRGCASLSGRQPSALRAGARRRRRAARRTVGRARRRRALARRGRRSCSTCADTAERLRTGRFVLAVVGEFSSGKSFLLNALLGKIVREERAGTARITGLLATDINPSTATITELSYADEEIATAYYPERPQRTHSDRRPLALRRRRRRSEAARRDRR